MNASFFSLSQREPPAEDTIRLSDNIDALRTERDTVVMQCAFAALKLVHLVDMLNTVHVHRPCYAVGSYNCW